MPGKRTLLFFSVVVISFVLMTYQSKKGHGISDNSLHRVLDYSHGAEKSFSDLIKAPFKRLALREEDNIRLRKRVNELLQEREKFQEAVLENKRLREDLKLKETKKNYIATAQVIARGVDRWSHVFVLDKGSNDGIAKDMAAVTPAGLVGKILNVSGSNSNVLLLTDINFSASVRLQESRKEGILSGTGSRNCLLKYIPYEEDVKTGDILITSGLDSLFPPGIPVGYVSKVDKKGRAGDLQYIEVIPFQDDSKIEEVTILK